MPKSMYEWLTTGAIIYNLLLMSGYYSHIMPEPIIYPQKYYSSVIEFHFYNFHIKKIILHLKIQKTHLIYLLKEYRKLNQLNVLFAWF